MKDCFKFISDVSSDYELRWYNCYCGRSGPAVDVDDEVELQKVIRATEVEVRWDTLGKGLIVYPRANLRLPKVSEKVKLLFNDERDCYVLSAADGKGVSIEDCVSEVLEVVEDVEFDDVDELAEGDFCVRMGEKILRVETFGGHIWEKV